MLEKLKILENEVVGYKVISRPSGTKDVTENLLKEKTFKEQYEDCLARLERVNCLSKRKIRKPTSVSSLVNLMQRFIEYDKEDSALEWPVYLSKYCSDEHDTWFECHWVTNTGRVEGARVLDNTLERECYYSSILMIKDIEKYKKKAKNKSYDSSGL